MRNMVSLILLATISILNAPQLSAGTPISCSDILSRGLSAGDGEYLVDPDGVGGNDAFWVYCDMTNGGWQLIYNRNNAYFTPDHMVQRYPTAPLNFDTNSAGWLIPPDAGQWRWEVSVDGGVSWRGISTAIPDEAFSETHVTTINVPVNQVQDNSLGSSGPFYYQTFSVGDQCLFSCDSGAATWWGIVNVLQGAGDQWNPGLGGHSDSCDLDNSLIAGDNYTWGDDDLELYLSDFKNIQGDGIGGTNCYPDGPTDLYRYRFWARAPGVPNPDNGHRYERFDETISWHDAGAYCESLNGYLATITSQMEDEFVYDNLASFSPNEMVWLGATDEALEGVWEWQTGEVWDYANWAGGEPNDCGGIEHYLVYFTPHDPPGRAGFWNDLGIGDHGGCGCGGCIDEWYPMSFICEWDAAPKMEVKIDIKPGSCPNPLNVKSRGVLPVAVLGTADFDVTQIDPESITLQGISPLRLGFEDVSTPFEALTENCGGCTSQGADGHTDMTFKFDKNAVVEALGAVQDGDCVKIPLTGKLRDEFGGNPIHGADSVRMIVKKKKKENLVFFDDFQRDNFLESWISGSDCGPNTITNVDGRIQATENCNYIETLEFFSGNLRVEVDVEKVGPQDHGCWDFFVELASPQATGAIRFDEAGVDGIGIGYIWDTCGDEFIMDPSAPNKGRAVLTYSEPNLHFYFENADGEVLATDEFPVGSFGASRIRIWLAAHPDTPRYIDNVSVYQ